MLHRFGLANVYDALENRHACAEHKQQNGDDEAPEVDFASITERMLFIRTARGSLQAVEKEKLIAGVDDRVDAFAEHRRAAGDGGGRKFGNDNKQVSGSGRVYDLF